MTNSVRNSGPDSTRRREPATDTYRDPVLVSQKRATRCWVASSSGSMWSVVSKAWRNWCETRRLLCRVSTSGGKAHLDGGCRGVLPCDGGVPPCEGCRAARFRRRGRPARLPGTGGRKTRRGSNADPLGFDSDIATVGLGVSWAAWAATRGGRQGLPDVVAPVSPAPEPTDQRWAGAVAVVGEPDVLVTGDKGRLDARPAAGP